MNKVCVHVRCVCILAKFVWFLANVIKFCEKCTSINEGIRQSVSDEVNLLIFG